MSLRELAASVELYLYSDPLGSSHRCPAGLRAAARLGAEGGEWYCLGPREPRART